MRVVEWAEGLAEFYLSEALPRRWRHVQSVARKAEGLRPAYGADADLVVTSAWLHDIGYAPQLAVIGFHPLDGAAFLRSVGAPERLCGLVAHHSGAAVEAELRGLALQLAEFPNEETLVRDGLWYCDMTIGPGGEDVTFPGRLAEIRERYGPDHTVPRAIAVSAGAIDQAIRNVHALVEGKSAQRRSDSGLLLNIFYQVSCLEPSRHYLQFSPPSCKA